MTYNLIIAGSRHFVAPVFYQVLKRTVQQLELPEDVCVLSGCQVGMDCWGEVYAKERGWPVIPFPADWNRGKAGGPIRNSAMAKVAHGAVIICLDDSSGSHDMWKKAKARDIDVLLVEFPRQDGNTTFDPETGTWKA